MILVENILKKYNAIGINIPKFMKTDGKKVKTRRKQTEHTKQAKTKKRIEKAKMLSTIPQRRSHRAAA